MAIINGEALLRASPIVGMVGCKRTSNGVSYGLSEVGYDLRVKQKVEFFPPDPVKALQAFAYGYGEGAVRELMLGKTVVTHPNGEVTCNVGRTALASSVEQFQIPKNLWGELRNKSTWARRFVDAALGTDMEPDWHGFLTIEIVFNGDEHICIESGSGILKAVFHELKEEASYGDGKYNHQPDMPVPARNSI